MIGSSCAVDLYMNFKASNVLDYTSVLLNDLVPSKVSFKYFKKFILGYYQKIVLDGETLDTILDIDEKEEVIKKELKTLKITDDRLKPIYVIFFRKSLISGSISASKEMKDLYNIITTTILFALELDKYIKPNSKDVSYDNVSKTILENDKELFKKDLVDSINKNSKELKEIFKNSMNKNESFNRNYLNTEVFRVDLVQFEQGIQSDYEDNYYSRFQFILGKLDEEKPKEVEKMLNKNDIKNGFTNVELEMVSWIILSNALNGKHENIYVDLPDNYLGKVASINLIHNMLSSVKKRLYLNIRYDQLIKFNNEVRDLNNEGFFVSCTKGNQEIDSKKLYGTKAVFIPYDNTVTFLKNLDNAILARVKVIVVGANKKSEKKSFQDKKVDYIVNY